MLFPPLGENFLVSQRRTKERMFFSFETRKYHFSPNQDVLTENCNSRCCRQRILIIINGERKAESILTNTMCCNNENNFVIKLPSSERIFILSCSILKKSAHYFLFRFCYRKQLWNFFIKTLFVQNVFLIFFIESIFDVGIFDLKAFSLSSNCCCFRRVGKWLKQDFIL